jgi:hypothetical protein
LIGAMTPPMMRLILRLPGHPQRSCRAVSTPRRCAPAVRVGLPSNPHLGEDCGEPGAERVHGDGVAALARRRSYPQFLSTNVTGSRARTVAVNTSKTAKVHKDEWTKKQLFVVARVGR